MKPSHQSMKRWLYFLLALAFFSTWLVVIMYLGIQKEDVVVLDNTDRVKHLKEQIKEATKEQIAVFTEFKDYLSHLRHQILLENSKKLNEKNAQEVKQKNSSIPFKDVPIVQPAVKNCVGIANYSGQEVVQCLQQLPKTMPEDGRPVIAVLVLSCDRVTVRRSLDRLTQFRPSKGQFPIIVSQDCSHKPTTNAILSFGDQLFLIKNPDQSEIQVPLKERKFKGYFKIARHYGWALNQTFSVFGFSTVIIVEDDLDISEDFYEYFLGTYSLLRNDPSLWCVSAWNDNGNTELVDDSQPQLLYRTDFFPGLGWMLTDTLWRELAPKWPKSYWDDWIRKPEQRKGRACIRPEISRTKTFGKIGVSNGLFYEKHLKFIKLNEEYVAFTQMNLTFLLKDNYDSMYLRQVFQSNVVNYQDLKSSMAYSGPVMVTYKTKEEYKKLTKKLGLMDDFRSGVPRTAYFGIVSTFWMKSVRVYLVAEQPWKGYDITWS